MSLKQKTCEAFKNFASFNNADIILVVAAGWN
jgi:hypothetical protein